MGKRTLFGLVLVLVLSAFLSALAPAQAAAKYSLAFMREVGYFENSTCNDGKRDVTVWVFDEQGNPVPGAEIWIVWPDSTYTTILSATGTDGKCVISMLLDWNDFQIRCGNHWVGIDSDTSPLLSTHRFNCNGDGVTWNGSYEVGFLYKSNGTNAGAFDTETNCTLNTGNNGELDAPYTRSLAYNSIDCTNTRSDDYVISAPNTSFGQTFVANADRVVGVEFNTAETGSITWNCQIFQGGPTGTAVSPIKTTLAHNSGRYFVPFGVNECVVVPGQTYYAKIWPTTGTMKVTRTISNVYPGGQYYENGVAVPGSDLSGSILCMNYGTSDLGSIIGTIVDNQGNPVKDAKIIITPGDLVITSSASGTFSSLNMTAGTYTLTANAPGYCQGTATETVVTGTTKNVTITCQKAGSITVLNPSFTNGMTSWASGFTSYDNDAFGVPAYSAPKWAGQIMSYGKGESFTWQKVSGLTIGRQYTLSTFIRTDSYDATKDYPTNVYCSVYVDTAPPVNGTPNLTGVVFHPYHSHKKWSFIQYPFTAASNDATICLKYKISYALQWNFASFDDVAVSTCEGLEIPSFSIVEALGLADGADVQLTDKIVTTAMNTFTNAFYIEDMDRTGAIRVGSTTKMFRGDTVNVTGKMATNSDGERYIDTTNGSADMIKEYNNIDPIPETITMTGRDVGGTNLNANTKGVYQGKGLYNVGKVVTVFGRITYKDQAVSSAKFFYLDDGSGLYDGNGNAAATGIRIDMGSWTNPTAANALVTGVVTKKKLANGNEVRVIRPIGTNFITGF